jgi:hypothetical protein
MKKMTLATVKSFIKKNPELLISNRSSFDGMVDCVMPCNDQSFSPAIRVEDACNNRLGIQGAWFVLGGGDRFYEFENDQFKGIEVYNCCGQFILAVAK